ncbi:MAG: hypothetical protein IJX49_01265, partial [Clostridia bacterium]|nr:hypothetical protein [Clostridia bacterium]
MKKQKRIKSFITYILTGLLSLIVLLIPVFSYQGFWTKGESGVAAEANVVEPTVSLTWVNSTVDSIAYPDEAWIQDSSAQKSTLTAKLTLENPQEGVNVRVNVQTFDISARAKTSSSNGDYDGLNEYYVLNASETEKTFQITVYRQIDFAAGGDQYAVTAYEDCAMWGGRTNTKLFGVRIVSVENGIEDQGRNSLVGAVLSDSTKDVTAKLNSNISYYKGSYGEGKTFASATREYNVSFQFDDTDLSPKQSTTKTLSNLSSINDEDLKILQDRYGSEMEYYYRFHGYVLSSCWNATGITFEIKEGEEKQYYSDWSEPSHKGSGSHYDIPSEESGDDKFSKGVSHELRESTSTFNKYLKYNGGDLSFYVKNRSLSTVHRYLNSWSYDIMTDNNAQPTVTGYRVASGSYGYGDEVYIAVDFSKHVQVTSGENLKLRTSIGNKQAIFDYYGGQYTDTLVFRKSFDDAEEYNGSQIKVENFEVSNDATVYDLFMNANNKNNEWVKPTGSSSKPLAVLDCSIDTRSPDVGSNYASKQVLKSHTVPVEVANVSDGARMDICWTASSLLSSVNQWNAVPFSGNGTTNVTGSNYTGNMYLHVRVTSATGRWTVQTFGPYAFDNTPPKISQITVEDENVYQSSHQLTATVKDLETSLAKVYLYAVDQTGNTVVNGLLVYDSESGSNSLQAVGGDKYEMTVTADMLGLVKGEDIPDDELYGEYRLGFKGVDRLGNESTITYYFRRVAFDARDAFETSTQFHTELIQGNNYLVFQSNEIYVLDGKSEFKVTVSADGKGFENMKLNSLSKNGKLVAGSAIASGSAEYDVVNWTSGGDASRGYVDITFAGTAEGYYDLILGADEKVSEVVRFIFTNENSTPDNYVSFYEDGNLLINEVWRFATNYFYQYGKDPIKYVEVSPDRNPIFSNKDKALEYAKFKEYQDLTPIVLTASQANQLEAGTNSEFMKATVTNGNPVTAAAGQIWIRYKSANWTVGNSSYNSASSWVYYYYGDGSGVEAGTTPVISDVSKLPSYLEDAITINAKKISNYDGEPYYLTANNGHQAAGGTPTYEAKAIFDQPLTYTEGFTLPIQYSGDPDIYDNLVNVDVDGNEEEAAYLHSGSVVNFENGYGALYYRLVGTTEYSVAYSGDNLYDLIGASGVYEVREIGNGYKSYYVYADKNEPILFYDFTHQNSSEATVSYLDKNIEGSVFNAKAVTLKGILYGDSSVAGYPSEVDEYAYVYIMNANGNVLLDFMTMEQLHAREDGYPLETGTYQIYVYDRLGNNTYMTIRINASEIEVTSQIRENSSITFYFNRRLTEIMEESFEIYRDGIRLDVDYEETLTFKESGVYRIKLTDIYGYSVDEEFEFTRDYPELRFYYVENGRFQEVIPVDSEDASASVDQAVRVIKNSDNAYLVVSAQDIRITYANDSDYLVRTSKGSPVIKQGGLNSVTLDIAGSEEDWEIEIAYVADPLVYVSVTCSYDVEAPLMEVFGTVNAYDFNDMEDVNADNVLFSSTEKRTVPIQNGDRINTDAVTVRWTDENTVRAAYYIKHGEEEVRVDVKDPSLGEYRVEGYGDYTFYVEDIIGNTAAFSFKLAETIELTYMLGDEEVKFKPNPLDYIEGDVYTDTQYTGEAVRLLFRNPGHSAFVWSDGTDTYLYYVDYNNGEVTISYRYGENGAEEEVVNTITNFENSGTLMTEPFRINYGKDGDMIYVEYPKPDKEYVFWQVRLADTKYVSPVILQIVQSNKLPNVQFKETDGELVQENATEFVGVNSELELVQSSVTEDIVSVVAYRSDVYTTDFSEIEGFAVYDGSSYQKITEHGYYKIVATNKYGNQQVMMVRLSFELEVNVLIRYADGEQRTFTLGTDKVQSFKSNQSLSFTVWDLECEISLKKNGVVYEPTIEKRAGHFYFELKEYGEYEMTALDSCGNLYKISISLKAPTEIEYNDYLTDFNEEALYKEQFYTNAPVSLDREAVEENGIGYVAYAYTGSDGKKGEKVVLYDVISQEQTAYDEETCIRGIGKEGNGVYEVTFSDFYGNKKTILVRISTAEQLVITRTTQSNMKADPWTIEDALGMGVWSNRLVTLTDNAKASKLLVDGKEVTFVNGRYVLEYPTMTTQEDVQRQVVYTDEYGNKYAFTVHLYRKTPEPEFNSKKELIDVNGETRVQGEFSYVWTDAKVSAKYSLDMGEEQAYISGQTLEKDGVYAFTFTDIAGNVATRTVTIDTKVVYVLKNGATTVANGITTNTVVSLYEDGEKLTVVRVEKDGEVLETDDHSFVEHGTYKL